MVVEKAPQYAVDAQPGVERWRLKQRVKHQPSCEREWHFIYLGYQLSSWAKHVQKVEKRFAATWIKQAYNTKKGVDRFRIASWTKERSALKMMRNPK